MDTDEMLGLSLQDAQALFTSQPSGSKIPRYR